jgi:hypothetical protein
MMNGLGKEKRIMVAHEQGFDKNLDEILLQPSPPSTNTSYRTPYNSCTLPYSSSQP